MGVMVTRETRQLLTHASQFHEAKKPSKNDVLTTLFSCTMIYCKSALFL
jgi:hypothetical protein